MKLRLLPALALLATGACTSTIAPPMASPRAVRAAGAVEVPPMKVGAFTLSRALPESRDRSIGLRALSIKPPKGSTFASYLGDTLAEQLRLAGKLDPASPLVLSATVTESSASTAIGTATGALRATFRLSHGPRILFEKDLRVDAQWNSSFIGAVAVMNAEREYVALYTRLVDLLLEDPDFRRALNQL